jgi:hypothetical protein
MRRPERFSNARPYSGCEMQTLATITCPLCDHAEREEMPINACQHFYRCKGCGETLRPLEGDCCVFCSFADETCPPIQARAGGC